MKDIDEIRRENLRAIEAERGGPSEAAKACSMSPAQFINLRDGAKDSKTGKPRGMRKDTARRIEAAAGKPPGWLDIDHSVSPVEEQAVTEQPPNITALLADVLAAVPVSLRPAAGKLLDSLASSPRDPAIRQSLDLIISSGQGKRR